MFYPITLNPLLGCAVFSSTHWNPLCRLHTPANWQKVVLIFILCPHSCCPVHTAEPEHENLFPPDGHMTLCLLSISWLPQSAINTSPCRPVCRITDMFTCTLRVLSCFGVCIEHEKPGYGSPCLHDHTRNQVSGPQPAGVSWFYQVSMWSGVYMTRYPGLYGSTSGSISRFVKPVLDHRLNLSLLSLLDRGMVWMFTTGEADDGET